MKHIGRIVTKNIKDVQKRVYDFIEVIEPSSFTEDNIPTLIIGLETARELYGKENVKVLDKRLFETVQWTHSKMEHRNIFENDLKKFIDDTYKIVRRSVSYEYLDFLYDKDKAFQKINNYKTSPSKIILKNKRHFYLFSPYLGIYGLSLDDTHYLGIPDEEIEDTLFNMGQVTLIDRLDLNDNKTMDYIGNDNIMLTFLCGEI